MNSSTPSYPSEFGSPPSPGSQPSHPLYYEAANRRWLPPAVAVLPLSDNTFAVFVGNRRELRTIVEASALPDLFASLTEEERLRREREEHARLYQEPKLPNIDLGPDLDLDLDLDLEL